MLTLPAVFIDLLVPFMPLFRSQTWAKAQLLLVGAVLSPGKRTVTSALRVLGLDQERGFAKYHHVLNRARWSPRELSKLLLFLLLRHLDTGEGPLVFGMDETLERRWGRRISARGIYRDAVRSSDSHLVKASGLRWVLIRDPLAEFRPQALLCTDLEVAAPQIIEWFVLRWQLEVTFQESRAHLGIETQRQWSDLAIARTTPILFGLFSWVTLAAHVLKAGNTILFRSTSWYSKSLPTFSDAIALVRQRLWFPWDSFPMSPSPPDMVIIPRLLLSRLVNTACYAA